MGAPRPDTAPVHAPAPAYHPVVEPAYPDEPPVYTYTYAVKDDYSFSNFNAHEQRDGYNTAGGYEVALPDGRTQIVTYTATKDGYVADVRYEGEAKYPEYNPAPAYAPAPVVKVAAPVVPVVKAAPVYHAAAPVYHSAPVYHAAPAPVVYKSKIAEPVPAPVEEAPEATGELRSEEEAKPVEEIPEAAAPVEEVVEEVAEEVATEASA